MEAIILPDSKKPDPGLASQGKGSEYLAVVLEHGARGGDPGEELVLSESIESVHAALRTLPWRQKQTFLLRTWEEMSVSETARSMGISEGSVKTHFSRATQTLRKLLKDQRDE